jgi:hypothetical protein
MRTITAQTFKKKQDITERIEKLSGRQARIALLRLMTDTRMCDRMASSLDIAETYPKDA